MFTSSFSNQKWHSFKNIIWIIIIIIIIIITIFIIIYLFELE